MTRTAPLLILLVLSVPALAQSKKSKAHTHSPDDGRYSAVFPRDPSTSERLMASSGGNLTVQTARTEFGGLVYSVTYTDFPESFTAVAADKILDGVRDGMKGNDGVIKNDEKVTLDAVPGREYRIEAGKNAIRCRVYLDKQRLYQVMVTGPKDTLDGEEPGKFLSSFAWTK